MLYYLVKTSSFKYIQYSYFKTMKIVNKIANLPIPFLDHWGYSIIFIAALLEATPLFGLFIPGQIIIVLAGFFAKQGILDIGDVIFFAAFGAILGDLIGYFLGKKYGYSFITDYGKYFFFKKEYFKETKKIMNDHPGKTLVIGRFNSLTRAFAPFVAGSTDVPFFKFLIYNIIGGVTWAVSFFLVGYIFGASYELATQYVGRIILIMFIIGIGSIYIYYRIKRKSKYLKKQTFK